MLNAAAKAWVKALRSGKFKQTQDYLQTKDGYCCLGVACELALKAGVIKTKEKDEYSPGYLFDDDYATCLPEKVRRWLGLRTDEGHFERHFENAKVAGAWHGDSDALTYANDRGTTFERIADLIASEPKGLFRPQRKVVKSVSGKKKASGKKQKR